MSKNGKVVISLEPAMLNWLKTIAKSKRVSPSYAVSRLLRDAYEDWWFAKEAAKREGQKTIPHDEFWQKVKQKS